MRFSKVRDVKSPERGTDKAAGIDFFIPNDFNARLLQPNTDCLIPSGIKMEIPEGYMLMAADKSGVVTSKHACERIGLICKHNTESSLIVGAKIVDEDYHGEIHIHVINIGEESRELYPGMKIAQFILVPVSYASLEEVPEAELFRTQTARGEGGFGSTGVR